MKEYYICHSGRYGPRDKPFVKIPENAIILGPHTVESEPIRVGSRFFGLLPKMVIMKTPGIMYLMPKDDHSSGETPT